jgi:hypothetical protein
VSDLQRVVSVIKNSFVIVDVFSASVLEGLRVVVPRGRETERLQQLLSLGASAVSLKGLIKNNVRSSVNR